MKKKIEQASDIELFYLLNRDKKTAEKAFAELYSRHSSRVYAYCRRFLGSIEEAQDVFQDTFYKFFNSAKDHREMTNVPGFLLKIARNLCVNAKKKVRNHLLFEDYMVAETNDSSEKDELLKLIKTALELLSEEYREIFILREYDGLKYSEIAKILDIPVSTVKIRIFRAKEKIRKILAPYLEDLSNN